MVELTSAAAAQSSVLKGYLQEVDSAGEVAFQLPDWASVEAMNQVAALCKAVAISQEATPRELLPLVELADARGHAPAALLSRMLRTILPGKSTGEMRVLLDAPDNLCARRASAAVDSTHEPLFTPPGDRPCEGVEGMEAETSARGKAATSVRSRGAPSGTGSKAGPAGLLSVTSRHALRVPPVSRGPICASQTLMARLRTRMEDWMCARSCML